MLALDTNVLARYYVRETDASRATLAQAEAARKDILRVFEHLLARDGTQVEDRAGVEGALANLRAGFDFADALHHASSRGCAAFLSFDARRFAKKARRMALAPPVRVPG